MSEPEDVPLFDLGAYTTEPPPVESADAKRTRRNNEAIDAGRHPVTGGATHPDVGTCGDCARAVAHTRNRTWWKCELVPITFGPGTDIRLKWPACDRHDPLDLGVA